MVRNGIYGNDMTSEEEEETDGGDNGNVSTAMEWYIMAWILGAL